MEGAESEEPIQKYDEEKLDALPLRRTLSAKSWQKYKRAWCKFCQVQKLRPGEEPKKNNFINHFVYLKSQGNSYNAITVYLSALNKFMMAIFGYK